MRLIPNRQQSQYATVANRHIEAQHARSLLNKINLFCYTFLSSLFTLLCVYLCLYLWSLILRTRASYLHCRREENLYKWREWQRNRVDGTNDNSAKRTIHNQQRDTMYKLIYYCRLMFYVSSFFWVCTMWLATISILHAEALDGKHHDLPTLTVSARYRCTYTCTIHFWFHFFCCDWLKRCGMWKFSLRKQYL